MFAALGKTTLTKALADRSQLSKILETHVVKGRLAPADLVGTHQTLSGSSITSPVPATTSPSRRPTSSAANIQTANATVYVVDRVLMPS